MSLSPIQVSPPSNTNLLDDADDLQDCFEFDPFSCVDIEDYVPGIDDWDCMFMDLF